MEWLIGLVILGVNIWATISLFKSDAETVKKVIWLLVIFLLSPIGVIIWYFAGPKEGGG